MSAKKTSVWFCALLLVFQVALCVSTTATTQFSNAPPTDRCDLRSLHDAIYRVEQHFEEKIEVLRHDIRNIEHQGRGTQRAALDCRNDVGRLMGKQERTRRYNQHEPNQSLKEDATFDQKLEDLSRKLELTIATLRLVNYDLSTIKQNVSNVVKVTNAIWDKIEIESNIQSIFKFTPDQPVSTPQTIPKNCQEVKLKSPSPASGIYLVQPDSTKPPFMVFCDMVVQDGGWLTIHSRYDGTQDFFLNWQDYKVGFGNIAGEHWLGLDKIYQLTGSEMNELLIELVDPENIRSMVVYSYFSIGSEEEGYPLKVLGGYRGNAADSLGYHAGGKFSTKDKDQDSWSEGNCALSHSGAWWYKACDKSNLNGKYAPGPPPEEYIYQTMYWGAPAGPQIGLQEARMLIRPRGDSYA